MRSEKCKQTYIRPYLVARPQDTNSHTNTQTPIRPPESCLDLIIECFSDALSAGFTATKDTHVIGKPTKPANPTRGLFAVGALVASDHLAIKGTNSAGGDSIAQRPFQFVEVGILALSRWDLKLLLVVVGMGIGVRQNSLLNSQSPFLGCLRIIYTDAKHTRLRVRGLCTP